jgi:hypothetical protein
MSITLAFELMNNPSFSHEKGFRKDVYKELLKLGNIFSKRYYTSYDDKDYEAANLVYESMLSYLKRLPNFTSKKFYIYDIEKKQARLYHIGQSKISWAMREKVRGDNYFAVAGEENENKALKLYNGALETLVLSKDTPEKKRGVKKIMDAMEYVNIG